MMNQERMARSNVPVPMIMNAILQPTHRVSSARGVEAESQPIPPISIRIAVIIANSLAKNHSAKIFIAGMKMTATPRPTKIRAKMASETVGERPKSIAPREAINVNRVTAFLGPRESDSSPAGSCMMA